MIKMFRIIQLRISSSYKNASVSNQEEIKTNEKIETISQEIESLRKEIYKKRTTISELQNTGQT